MPKSHTVISFMEQRQSKAENVTNDITLSQNKHTTHDIIIKGGWKRQGAYQMLRSALQPCSRALARLPQRWWEIH